MLCIIYKLINIITNMYYIGQTWRTLEERFDNGRGYLNSKYLNSAIKKYGKENFCYEILTVCSTQEIADYWEDFFIEKYDSRNRKKGYNLRGGGSHGKLSNEQKEKLSASKRGKKLSEEHKNKISIGGMGRKATENTKKKMSRSMREISLEHEKEILSSPLSSGKLSKQIGVSAASIRRYRKKAQQQRPNTGGLGLIPLNKNQTKLSKQQIEEIINSNLSELELAQEFDVHPTTIKRYVKNYKK